MAIREAGRIAEKSFAAVAKTPGGACSAYVSFERKGPAEKVTIHFGIAPGSGWLYRYKADQVVFLAQREVSLLDDIDFKSYGPFTLQGVFPTDFPHPRIDAYVAVVSPRKVELSNFWDDVYTFAKLEYRNLTATFG